MQAEDRIIHFSTELFHKPATHSRSDLQKLYYDLSQSGTAAYDNVEMSQPALTRFHSRRSGKNQSIAIFLPDRIVLIEEWATIPMATFLEKIRLVSKAVFTTLNISEFVTQTATLRSTFALTHFDDARRFLLDHACQQESKIDPHFQRPVAVAGLRFSLPETEDHPGNLNVVIESYRHSANEILVEVKGTFRRLKIVMDNIEEATQNVQVCRRFITDNVFPFLNQYDTPKEGLV